MLVLAETTGPIESQDQKGWQWALDVNLMGVVYGAKVMTPLIKQHGEGGWIVNVASMAGMGGVPYLGAYTATKAAVVALSESWAGELGREGHTCICSMSLLLFKLGFMNLKETVQHNISLMSFGHLDENSFANSTKQMVENGIEVSIVGKRVVEALNDGEFYIFTHPNYRPIMQGRTAAIDAAFIKSAQSPLLEHIVNQKIEMP